MKAIIAFSIVLFGLMERLRERSFVYISIFRSGVDIDICTLRDNIHQRAGYTSQFSLASILLVLTSQFGGS